jgi:hypothetical protein
MVTDFYQLRKVIWIPFTQKDILHKILYHFYIRP